MPRRSQFSTIRPLVPGSRPLPPASLRPDMAAEWEKIVNSLPGGWFKTEQLPYLAELCRSMCYARDISAELDRIDVADPEQEKRYDRLHLRYTRTTNTMTNLGHKLRLTVQAQRAPSTVRDLDPVSPPLKKPWDDDNGGDAPVSRN